MITLKQSEYIISSENTLYGKVSVKLTIFHETGKMSIVPNDSHRADFIFRDSSDHELWIIVTELIKEAIEFGKNLLEKKDLNKYNTVVE